MKKWFFLIFVIMCLFSVKANASSWKFLWDDQTTNIEVPLGSNIQNYVDIPTAYLYKDGMILNDAEITYLTTGDWLFLLSDVDTSKVGTYYVWYKASENKYKPGQCQGYKCIVTFNVVDEEKPIFVQCPIDMNYVIGTEKPDYLSKITAKDNSGKCEILVDDSLVDYETPGQYAVEVIANDGYNIKTTSINLNVIDSHGPIITFLGENNSVTIGLNEEINLMQYFKAIDKIDGDVTNSIKYEKFDTSEEKSFALDVYFYDKNGNYDFITISIDIVDKSIPKIVLNQTDLILEYGTDYLASLTSNIKLATLGDLNISSKVKIDLEGFKEEVGKYVIEYSYNDGIKKAFAICNVSILSTIAPVLIVKNIEIKPGEIIDFNEYISVIDDSDPEIMSKIEYDDSLVDYLNEGIYPVTVSVVNSSNLSTTETLYVTIVDQKLFSGNDSSMDYSLLIICGVLVIVIVGGSIFFFQKKKLK